MAKDTVQIIPLYNDTPDRFPTDYTMWRIFMMVAIPLILGTTPSKPFEGPLWGQRKAEALFQPSQQGYYQPDHFQQRYLYDSSLDRDLRQFSKSNSEGFVRPVTEKRALAMFARWGFINSIGKNRTPIRSKILYNPESLSTQTRGRIMGQPLRWG